MIFVGQKLPYYFADGFYKPTTKTLDTLVWFSDDFCVIFTKQDFVGRMTKIEDRYWIEIDFFVHSSIPNKSETIYGIKGTSYPYIHDPHTQNSHNPSLLRFYVLKYFHMPKLSVVNQNLYMQHIIPTSLLQILIVLPCIQENQIPIQS